jgi:tetratricopeptide (TPR) repeat protein
MDSSDFNRLYALVTAGFLMTRKQYRLAIPHCEQAIQLLSEQDEPLAMVDMLWRAGQCYNRIGLRDRAAVRLRDALKILRDYPDDSHLPSVLLDLGNAIRKEDPGEAERCYKEAAEIHLAMKQPESASQAWVNLGIMCSEQGRFEESLEHYENALKVRERSTSTSPFRMGGLLNNMANCYRRMGDFAEAHKLADRAGKLLASEGGSALAAAFGTRGLIYFDAGSYAEAVEWRKPGKGDRGAQAARQNARGGPRGGAAGAGARRTERHTSTPDLIASSLEKFPHGCPQQHEPWRTLQ